MGFSDLALIDRDIEIDAQENRFVMELKVGEFSNHEYLPLANLLDNFYFLID
jgi:thermostable 8-oxoguanine DNA glycosylase